MLISDKNGCEEELNEIIKKWKLDCAVVGEVTNSGKMELFWHNEKCAEIPIAPLSENSPILKRPVSDNPQYLNGVESLNTKTLEQLNPNEIFTTLLKTPDISDKAWVYEQYDSTLQTNTLIKA